MRQLLLGLVSAALFSCACNAQSYAPACGSSLMQVPIYCGCSGTLMANVPQGAPVYNLPANPLSCCGNPITNYEWSNWFCNDLVLLKPRALENLGLALKEQPLLIADCKGIYHPFARGTKLDVSAEPRSLNLRRRIPLS
jgi:hypothetical protein